MGKTFKDDDRYKVGLAPVYWVAGIILFVILTMWFFSGQG